MPVHSSVLYYAPPTASTLPSCFLLFLLPRHYSLTQPSLVRLPTSSGHPSLRPPLLVTVLSALPARPRAPYPVGPMSPLSECGLLPYRLVPVILPPGYPRFSPASACAPPQGLTSGLAFIPLLGHFLVYHCLHAASLLPRALISFLGLALFLFLWSPTCYQL